MKKIFIYVIVGLCVIALVSGGLAISGFKLGQNEPDSKQNPTSDSNTSDVQAQTRGIYGTSLDNKIITNNPNTTTTTKITTVNRN